MRDEIDVTKIVIPHADVVKYSPRIGAEIRNIKLSADLPDDTIAAIHGLVLEHKVIFFRDQGHLDDAEQERFALRFGKPSPYPEGTMPLLEIDSAGEDIQADIWHIDWSCMDAYPKISVLRGVVIRAGSVCLNSFGRFAKWISATDYAAAIIGVSALK
ncbi:hypothetical protein GOL96_30645 [Sinorhizobium medicae]|nr:hypothetical protein [Sinorhizobium medicae]MDX1238065.1 hypothetical protein [Sinorhizobium medicae]